VSKYIVDRCRLVLSGARRTVHSRRTMVRSPVQSTDLIEVEAMGFDAE
jgi:hypothetical protein